MTRLIVTVDAAADADDILDFLYRESGAKVAEDYGRRFQSVVERVVRYPKIGVARPDLGSEARVVIIAPYVMIYDFKPRDRVVVLLRILHGRRDISERLLKR